MGALMFIILICAPLFLLMSFAESMEKKHKEDEDSG